MKHKLELVKNGPDEVLATCELCSYMRAVPLGLNGELLFPGVSVDSGDTTASHSYTTPGFSIGAGVVSKDP